jgi:3-deoxy-D-arabino-heptulosonate 7-phosphate (DAHP) synthase
MLGEDTSLPIFISPAGMAGLAHPLAEKGLAKAAGVCGIIQMVRREPRRVSVEDRSSSCSSPLGDA